MTIFKNEIVITQSEITLFSINGRSWPINKKHFDTVRTAINKSNSLRKRNKHTVIKIDMLG